MKLELSLHVFPIVGAGLLMMGCGTSSSGSPGIGGSGGTRASGGNSGSAGRGGAGGNSGSAGRGGAGGNAGSSGVGGSTGAAGTQGAGGAAGTSSAGGTTVATPSFDWVGVVGSGQSLSTGFTPPSLTTSYYNNLMLKQSSTSAPGTGAMNPTAPVPGTTDKPWDTTLSDLAVVPLVEPLRAAGSGFPRPYPINLWGETHHGAMAREITHFVTTATPGTDYVTVHTVVGESGQGIDRPHQADRGAPPAIPGAPTRRRCSRPVPSRGWQGRRARPTAWA